MKVDASFPSAVAYSAWLNKRIGQVIREIRVSRGMSTYRLAKLCRLTDQTLLNIEAGRCERGSLSGGLAQVCYHLGIRMKDLYNYAETATFQDSEPEDKPQSKQPRPTMTDKAMTADGSPPRTPRPNRRSAR